VLTHKLIVPRTQLRTVGEQAFGVAAARVWKSLYRDFSELLQETS